MLFKWLRRKEEARLKEIEDISRKAKAKQGRIVDDATFEMLSKECPINGALCYNGCVHFRCGWVHNFDWNGEDNWLHHLPHCKLWRR